MTPRQEFVLAAMLAGDSAAELSPVQAQKLFFLIDQNAAKLVNGPLFSFKPYDYGPFDSAVYSDLDMLSSFTGDVEVVRDGSYRTYRLTDQGKATAQILLNRMDPALRDYIGRLKDWVKSLGFRDLVSAIYEAYPDMRANSIFRG